MLKVLEDIITFIVCIFWLAACSLLCAFIVISYVILYPLGGSVLCQKGTTKQADWFWDYLTRFVEHWGRWNFKFSGERLPERETVIAIANHQWVLDWLMIFSLASRKGRLGVCKLFTKSSIRWLPGFGWGIYLLDFIFLSRNWDKDKESIHRTFNNLKFRGIPFWLISHLEGTRITPEKLKQSHEFAKKNDLPTFQNVLLPRQKGFIAMVEELREGAGVNALYDFTLIYNDGKKEPSIKSIVFRRGGTMHIHVKRYPIETIPKNKEELSKWVLARWKEKDELIDTFQQKGEFPDQFDEPFKHLPLML